jgi:glycosyltransferase involved in cell wall biosynthesis
MKISILNPDLSGNAVGRAYLLAKMLQREYEVEMIGPLMRGVLWEPVSSDRGLTFKTVNPSSRLQRYTRLPEVYRLVSGDVIYAHGPFLTSYGIGLAQKAMTRKPLVLDIDDWEMGICRSIMADISTYQRLKYVVRSTLELYNTASVVNVALFEKLAPLADEITVSNSFLEARFGGTIVHHAKDTDSWSPERYDKGRCRAAYGFDQASKIVMFFGTIRRHKGVEDLIEAVSLLGDSGALLVLVGVDERDRYASQVMARASRTLGTRFVRLGMQPFEKVPEFLAMADVVVVPQRRSPVSIGQTPAKLFDAMSLGKPIITTDVGDAREILEGCGWITEPGDVRGLANAISFVVENREEAARRGAEARRRCVERYSWSAMTEVLRGVFDRYDTGGRKGSACVDV